MLYYVQGEQSRVTPDLIWKYQRYSHEKQIKILVQQNRCVHTSDK